jgi:hypothetical protein
METHLIAELFASWLSIPLIALCFIVFFMWRKSLTAALFSPHLTPESWLIVGIGLSFFTQAIHNMYWSGAIAAKFAGYEFSEGLIQDGIYWYIFYQVSAALSAICHIKAALAIDKTQHGPNAVRFMMCFAVLDGLIFVWLLIQARHLFSIP